MKRRLFWAGSAIVIIVALAASAYLLLRPGFYQTPLPTPEGQKAAKAPVPRFDHVVLIVLENKGYGTVIGNSDAPYLNKLAKDNSLATNYYANFHPSLPNYLALTGGTNAGITSDCSPSSSSCTADGKSIADELEHTGLSWKAYQEDMPGPCVTHNAGTYAVRHDPFVYYPGIRDNAARCNSHVVPFSQLSGDLSSGALPAYSFITPNLCHDMHDCPIASGDAWLKTTVPNLLHSSAFTKQNSLLVITFDEAEGNDKQNKIPTILIGPNVKKHFTSRRSYNHYSLLHTIETAWNLGTLTKNDAGAPLMSGFFK